MAARPASAEAVSTADSPTTSFPLPAEGAIEVLGRQINRATAVANNGHDAAATDEAVRALRVLALDNLVDLVQLREKLAAAETRASEAEAHLTIWRQRAHAEAAQRQLDARESFRRQRELITVLHRQLIDNDVLQDDLAWRKRPWWRRLRRSRKTAQAA